MPVRDGKWKSRSVQVRSREVIWMLILRSKINGAYVDINTRETRLNSRTFVNGQKYGCTAILASDSDVDHLFSNLNGVFVLRLSSASNHWHTNHS